MPRHYFREYANFVRLRIARLPPTFARTDLRGKLEEYEHTRRAGALDKFL